MGNNDDWKKLALIHLCDYGINTMYDNSDWYLFFDDNIDDGDFVVVDGYLNDKRQLLIGYVEQVTIGEAYHAGGRMVVSRIVASGSLYNKPQLISEYNKRFEGLSNERYN